MSDYGAFYSKQGASALLRLSEDELAHETIHRPLLSITSDDGRLLYPAFQFILPPERIRPVLSILLTRMKPLNVLFSLVSPLEHFDNRRGIDIIGSREDLSPFLEYIKNREENKHVIQ